MTVLAYERAQMRQGGLQNDSDIRYLSRIRMIRGSSGTHRCRCVRVLRSFVRWSLSGV